MNHTTLLQFPALLVLFVAQAAYMKYLFESLRRKIYMDVMDYLIIQAKRENGGKLPKDFEQQLSSFGSSHLRLVRKDNK